MPMISLFIKPDHVAVRRAASLLAIVAFAACGTKEALGPLEPTGATGRLRLVNLITDPTRNPVNAILENVPFGVNLGYGGSTPSSLPAPNTANYAAVLTGPRSLVLKKTADTSVTVGTLNPTIEKNQDLTLYAIVQAGGTIAALPFVDDNSAVPAGQVRVRVVNMKLFGGDIDAFVTAPNADLSAATPVATNVGPRGASVYVSVGPLSAYQFRAVPAGTPPANRAANVLVSITPTAPLFAAGTGRTFIVADSPAGGNPPTAFVLSDQ